MKVKILIILSLLFSFFSNINARSRDDAFYKTNNLEKGFVAETMDFDLTLLNELCRNPEQKNIFFSPFGLKFALTIVYNGSGGNTQEELADVLKYKDMELDYINNSLVSIVAQLKKNKKVKLHIANSLWLNKLVEINNEFIKKMKKYYKSGINILDFSQSSAVIKINNWVSKNTKGKINKIIDSINNNTKMILLNALYFKGDWDEKFDEDDTRKRDFFLFDGSTKSVPMMENDNEYFYLSDYEKGYKIVRLPYKGLQQSMIIFLPEEHDGIIDLIKEIKENSLNYYLSNMYKTKGKIIMPVFQMNTDVDFKPVLMNLGIKDAFSENADFDEINDLLYFNDVKQKSYIDVNEKGTEAVTITIISFKEMSVQEEYFDMVVDKPFLFIIRDDVTGVPLFMGVIFEPIGY